MDTRTTMVSLLPDIFQCGDEFIKLLKMLLRILFLYGRLILLVIIRLGMITDDAVRLLQMHHIIILLGEEVMSLMKTLNWYYISNELTIFLDGY